MFNALGSVMNWECNIVDTKQIKELHPLIDVENGELVGGLYCPSDGSIDPTGMGYVFSIHGAGHAQFEMVLIVRGPISVFNRLLDYC